MHAGVCAAGTCVHARWLGAGTPRRAPSVCLIVLLRGCMALLRDAWHCFVQRVCCFMLTVSCLLPRLPCLQNNFKTVAACVERCRQA